MFRVYDGLEGLGFETSLRVDIYIYIYIDIVIFTCWTGLFICWCYVLCRVDVLCVVLTTWLFFQAGFHRVGCHIIGC